METSTTKPLSTVIARLAAFLALGVVVVVLIVVVSSSLEGSNGEDRPREKTPPREPQQPKETTYVVQPNDTLGSIAEKTGVPVEALLRLNPDIDPQALPAGAELHASQGFLKRGAAWAFAALALAVAAAPPASAAPSPPKPDARAWLLVDPSDGDRLTARASGAELSMASATKLMTAYVVLRELDPKKRVVAGSYRATAAESLMGLRAGDVVSVRDLLYGLLLASGNDAAVTLAEAASGSVDAFVARMNAAARRLGLDGTSYENPIGFDAPGQHTTATDLVALAIELREQPLFTRIVDTEEIKLPDGARPPRVENRNTVLRAAPWVNGVKTGYTNEARYVLVGSATRKGVTLVSALLGAPSEGARDAGTLELLRYGFSLYKRRTVLGERERVDSVTVRDRDVAVPVVAADEVKLTSRRDEDVEIRPVGVPAEVPGPVARGERLGSALVTVDGVREARVPLIAARSAAEASLLERIDAALPGRRAAAWGLLGFGVLGVALFSGAAVALLRRARRPG